MAGNKKYTRRAVLGTAATAGAILAGFSLRPYVAEEIDTTVKLKAERALTAPQTITINWQDENYHEMTLSRVTPRFSDSGKPLFKGCFLLSSNYPDIESLEAMRAYIASTNGLGNSFPRGERGKAPKVNTPATVVLQQPSNSSASWDRQDLESLVNDPLMKLGFISDISLLRSEYALMSEKAAKNSSVQFPDSSVRVNASQLASMYIGSADVVQAGRYDLVLPNMADQNAQQLLKDRIISQLKIQKGLSFEPVVVLSNIDYGQFKETEVVKPTGIGEAFYETNQYDGPAQRAALVQAVKSAYSSAVEQKLAGKISDIKTVLIAPINSEIGSFVNSGITVDTVVFNSLVLRERFNQKEQKSSVNFYESEFNAMQDMISEGLGRGIENYVITMQLPEGYSLEEIAPVRNLEFSRIEPVIRKFNANSPDSNLTIQVYMAKPLFTTPNIRGAEYLSFLEGSFYPVLPEYESRMIK